MTMLEQFGDVAQLFRTVAEEKASDLFLKVGAPPAIRVSGRVKSLGLATLTEEQMQAIVQGVAPPPVLERFEQKGEADCSYEVLGVGRFRVNIFRQRGYIGMAFRYIQSRIPSLEELNLPAETLRQITTKPRGLVLVTGTTGSGKSTSLAAMLNHINLTQEKHIITIEDPIEYAFTDAKCIIDQRELGQDTESFVTALKSIVRQSPDVIMIGEMRDMETVEAALHASETGHLVFSTLHTVNAMQTIERILNFFPVHQHNFLKQQLSLLLVGVISMRLLRVKAGQGRLPAVEVMVDAPTIKELLAEGKVREIYKAIREGAYYGMQTFNQALKILIQNDMISLEDALDAADSPDELRLEIRGVTKGAKSSGQH
jgi:twitching motility protein PilT